jgi:hypothetical protein
MKNLPKKTKTKKPYYIGKNKKEKIYPINKDLFN